MSNPKAPKPRKAGPERGRDRPRAEKAKQIPAPLTGAAARIARKAAKNKAEGKPASAPASKGALPKGAPAKGPSPKGPPGRGAPKPNAQRPAPIYEPKMKSKRSGPKPQPTSSGGPTRSGTVAILGRPNVGKSTLLNAALDVPLAIVTPAPQTTRETLLGVVHRTVDGEDAELRLLDTPGLHKAERALDRRMNRAAREAAADADVVVFVVDASEAKGVHPGDASLLGDLGAESQAILVLNKIDRVKDKAALLPIIEAYAKLRSFAAIIPISARRADGVDVLLDAVARLLPLGEHRFGPDDLTDRPMRFFAKEYVREQILLRARQEVPHAAAVSVDTFEEPNEKRSARISATVHVERDGQKKILIGTGGAMLKEIGTDARARIEELLGQHVHLELFVRVTPGWRDTPALLEELGIGSEAGDQ
jgi:GTP-binding protein Era